MAILQKCDRLPGVDYIEKFDDMPNSTLRNEILSLISLYNDSMTVDQVRSLVYKMLGGNRKIDSRNPIFRGYFPIVASTEATFYKHILKARLYKFNCLFLVCVENDVKHQSGYKKVISLLREYQQRYFLDFDVVGIELPNCKHVIERSLNLEN